MLSSSIYSIQLPFLGTMVLEESAAPTLFTLQAPLRDLYKTADRGEHRMVISDCDILIFKSNAALKDKLNVVYSTIDSIVDVQTLKLSVKMEQQPNESTQVAFVPIGCGYQERFQSLYVTINQAHDHLLATPLCQASLVLLFIRPSETSNQAYPLDCHAFAVPREALAFELCDLLRKSISKRATNPQSPCRRAFLPLYDNNEEMRMERPTKYFERKRPMSVMEYGQLDQKLRINKNHSKSNVNLHDLAHTKINSSPNPFSSSSLLLNTVQHARPPSPSPPHHTSQVLTMSSNIQYMSSPSIPTLSSQQPRQFVKASSNMKDETEEIVDDLMNIVETEKMKSQSSVKRQASMDPSSLINDCSMNKKRHFHHKKRSMDPSPCGERPEKVHSVLDAHILRPSIVLNRYADIGNYVPKLLRDHVTMRSSDSNENIFFRSSHGQLLNGFLQMDLPSSKQQIKGKRHHPSMPNINCDQEGLPQFRLNQTKSYLLERPRHSLVSNHSLGMENHRMTDDYRILQTPKSRLDRQGGMRILSFTPPSHSRLRSSKVHLPAAKPKRASSFNVINSEIPVDYRQYLRPTGHSAYLYAEKSNQPQATLEYSLGYFP